MRVAALVLGILGGLIAMIFGVGGVALGGAGGSAGLQLISVAVPIAALVGAGLVVSKPIPGAALMGGSVAGFSFMLRLNTVTLIPVALPGIGALLGFPGAQELSQGSGNQEAR